MSAWTKFRDKAVGNVLGGVSDAFNPQVDNGGAIVHAPSNFPEKIPPMSSGNTANKNDLPISGGFVLDTKTGLIIVGGLLVLLVVVRKL